MARIYVNAGKADGFYAGSLIETLNKNVPGKRVDVGRIDLMPDYTLFDIPSADAKRVVAALKGSMWLDKRLYSEVADADKVYAEASGGRRSKPAPRRSSRKSSRRR